MSATRWALVQYRRPGGDEILSAGLVDGKVIEFDKDLAGESALALLQYWDEVRVLLEGWVPDPDRVIPDAQLVAPLTYPGKVLCAGANYYSHALEMGVARPDPDAEPFFFMKPPRTTVIGPGEPVRYPRDPATTLDWEAELGIVIAHRVRDLRDDQARQHIAGYVVANDISARNRVARADAVSPHFVYDWLGHKGQDDFCPLGPGIVPAWQIDDPQQLRIRLSVNGVLKQDNNTSDMVIGIDRLVAAASRITTLEPGDVILSGTPAGVGAPRGDFLQPGDHMVVEIEGVGVLENELVAS